MKRFVSGGLAILTLLLWTNCSPTETNDSEVFVELRNLQATSLLGNELTIPERSPEVFKRLADNLKKAQANFEKKDSEMNIIWYGRRYAYLSDYQKAIEIYTQGLKQYPDSYKLYRHRGHKYIWANQTDCNWIFLCRGKCNF